jgi:hypothetical protein
MVWRCALLLFACGRVGFDARNAPADAPSDAMPTIAERLPCNSQVLLDSSGHDPHDVIRWVSDTAGEWVIGSHHYAGDDHKIERHRITSDSGVAVAGATEFVMQTSHVDVLAFEAVPSGVVMGFTDFNLQTAEAVALTPDPLAVVSHPLGPLANGNPPLARAGNGGLAMIGLVGGNLQVLALREDGSPTGVLAQLATPAAGADRPSMVALDSGLAVVWQSAAKGTCRLATLAADLSLVSGPVDLAVPGCSDPHVAWIADTRRIVVVADDPNNGAIVGATWDEGLSPVAAPRILAGSAHWVRIIGDGDGAWIAWAQNPAPQRVAYARLDSDANVTRLGTAVGSLDETLGHFHTMDRIGGATLVMWTDTTQNRTFSVERLCR